MARGSFNNVTENRTRSKRGTPTKEIEEKQKNDSVDKKSVVTRRKNITASSSSSKVEKKVNKKSDKFEADNSCQTISASHRNKDLNLPGKKQVLKKTPQNKAGRKRKVENISDELTEETIEKEPVGGQNKHLKTDTMDESSQDLIKEAKSDSTKIKNAKKVEEDSIGEHNNEDTHLEISTETAKEVAKISNSQEKDVSTTLDDSSQGSIKSGTTRKTRSARKIEENITEEQNETKDLKSNKVQSESETKADIVDDTSQDTTKPIRSGSFRKTRSSKKMDEDVNVELKETIAVEACKEKSPHESSAKIDLIDENSQGSVKLSKAVSTRKTRSTKRVEESVKESIDEDKDLEQKETEKIKIDDPVGKDKTDTVDENDKASLTKSCTRKTRCIKSVEKIIPVELEDMKAKEIKEKVICTEKRDDTIQDSLKKTKGRSTRKTRSSMKAEENIDATGDDSSVDSMNSNQSGSLKSSRITKRVGENPNDVEKKDSNEKEVELCPDSQLSLEANKVIASMDEKVTSKDEEIFVEKNLSKDTDKVLEQEVEERIEEDGKQLKSDCTNDNTQNFYEETKNLKDFDENILVEHNENSCEKEFNSGKLEDGAKEFDRIDNKNGKFEANLTQYENNAEDTNSKESVIDSQDSNVLQTCVNNNLAGENINIEKENEEKLVSNKYIEAIDGNDESSEIEKDLNFCGVDETTLLENVDGKVLNPEICENKHSKLKPVVEDNQTSNLATISDADVCSQSENHKDQTLFEGTSNQEPENTERKLDSMSGEIYFSKDFQESQSLKVDCGEGVESKSNVTSPESKIDDQSIITQDTLANKKTVEIIAGNKIAGKSSEELELTDKVCQRETKEILIEQSMTDIPENIDHEDSTTSMIGETIEKANLDIDVCSDKTEEASVINFESESSTTDSDIGNLIITDPVENTNTEIDTSELVSGTTHSVSDFSSVDDRNQKDISTEITEKEMNVTGNETLSPPTDSETTSSPNLAGTDKLEELKSHEIGSVNSKEHDLTVTSINSSMIIKETADAERKMALSVESNVNKISQNNVQMPLTVNSACNNEDENIAETSGSLDKLVDSSHGDFIFEENLKTTKKKKSNKSVKKGSSDLKEVEKIEAGKKIITTYEVSSNVDSKKGDKRKLADVGEGSSGTEVSLALKIKRKRVEGVESYDVGPSSLGEQAIPDPPDERTIQEQTQKLFADYQSEPGPSGRQQDSRRSTRKRKREDTSRESSAAPIRMYLEKFVPFLLEGLLKITYVRPGDPIQYLADWMQENKEAAYCSMNNKDSGDVSSDE